MLPSLPQVTIRQATSLDIPAITRYMDQALLVHRNLDWQPLMDWVTREPFLLRYEGLKLTALLSCAPDPAGVAWIHAFSTDQLSSDLEKRWRALLESTLPILLRLKSDLFSVALHDWYIRLLETSGFSIIQKIVVLVWNGLLPETLPLSPKVLIRPMERADLDAVVDIDKRAFDALWTISRSSMECAYLSSAHASVAELQGEIIGYELSTANHLSAHLTRLAVNPDYKHVNIGYSLARGMLEYFQRFRITQVTVNTQQSNAASIGLYRKLGFSLTGDTFPIYTYGIIN